MKIKTETELQKMLNQYQLPHIDLTSTDGKLFTLVFRCSSIYFLDFHDENDINISDKNDVMINGTNLSFLIFSKLLWVINNSCKLSSSELKYLLNLTDEQLLRYMNIFLLVAENDQFNDYRTVDDPEYLRRAIYTQVLSHLHKGDYTYE